MTTGVDHSISSGEQTILENAGPIIVTDAQGCIAVFNRAAERMLGYLADEVVGHCTLEMFREAREPVRRARVVSVEPRGELRSSFEALVARAREADRDVQRWTYVRKGGSTVPALVTLTALRDSSATITGFACVSMEMSEVESDGQGYARPAEAPSVGVIADGNARITTAYLDHAEGQLRLREQAQRTIQKAAEAASEHRTRFIAAIGHEIRTPLNVVLGMSHLAQMHAQSPVVQAYLEKIEASAKSLLGIFSNVLDFSKLDAGQMTVEEAPFSLAGLAGAMRALLSGLDPSRVTFRIDLADDLPSYVVGDGLRIQQVMTNLLSNAVKCTRQGEITLAMQVLQRKHDAVVLRICVRDTGVGMTRVQLRHVFDPFWQADSSATPSYAGTGIGLDLSNRLVELLGGQIDVESEPGKGTQFTVVLPLSVTDEKPVTDPRISAAARANGLLHGLRVLLVEDNLLNQQVFAEFLESFGIEVVIASNGEQAVDRVITAVFDLVLMDLQMPILDGYGATRAIRTLYAATQLPIIALSAGATGDDKRECYRAGMNDHVAKPFDPDTLTGMLAFWSGRTSTRYEESTSTEVTTEKQALFAPEQAVLRIDGNRVLYRSLLAMFLEHHEHTPAEVERLIASQDQKKMRAVAHRLTSEASHLGLLRLAKAAAGLQTVLRAQIPGAMCPSAQELLEAFEATVPEINAFLSRPSMLPPPPPMPRMESPYELVPAIRNISRQLAEHKLDALRALGELASSIADSASLSALHEVTVLAEQLKFAEAAARLERLAAVLTAAEGEAPA